MLTSCSGKMWAVISDRSGEEADTYRHVPASYHTGDIQCVIHQKQTRSIRIVDYHYGGDAERRRVTLVTKWEECTILIHV